MSIRNLLKVSKPPIVGNILKNYSDKIFWERLAKSSKLR
jgi:hypothetical protein